MLHGLKTAEKRLGFGLKLPATPFTLGSLGKAPSFPSAVPSGGLFGATAPLAVSTAASFLGVGSSTSATSTAGFSFGSMSPQSAGGSLFGTGFGTVPTPSAARTTYSDLGAGSAPSAVSTEGSLPEAGSTAFTFGSGNTSQVWADEAAVLHCFNPKTNKWKKQSSTCHPHHDSRLFVVNNELYVAGGSGSSLCPSASVEVYDEENNVWSVVEQTHIPPNKLGAVEIEGRVYFMVNKFPVDVGIRIPPGEVYQICLNDWKNLTQIDEDAVLCYMPVKTASLNAD